MLKTLWPESLRNVQDLQLGPVYLKHLGYGEVPNLLTIYELERPAILAYNEIKHILEEIRYNRLSEYSTKGLFALAVAHFEIMLSELMKKQLQFFPQKIGSYRVSNQNTLEEKRITKEIAVSKESVYRGALGMDIIENEIQKLSYKDLPSLINACRAVTSLKMEYVESVLHQLIEVKETRNLLLHNNLYVNDFYLKKTEQIQRSTIRGSKISIDQDYAVNSVAMILEIVYNIINEVRASFGKYTLLQMFERLWSYTFEKAPIRMQDCVEFNKENDVFEGPFKIPGFISNSERMYMEFWQAQRTNKPINNLSMVHLNSGSKLSYLVDVFGELRLTHW